MAYSQSREEAMLMDIFKDRVGSILDIGAFDGKTNSNSLALIERGWRAVLIEPSPTSFLKLLTMHSDNKQVTLINAAMGVENTLRTFHECAEDQCSTFDDDLRAVWKGAGRAYRSYLVPQMTPAMLVNQVAGGYDVISIDTEGTSFDIFRALPIQAWLPTVWIIEHDERIVEITKFARQWEYHAWEVDEQNVMLVRR